MSNRRTILRALTPEAMDSLGGAIEIPITTYPFRVGRDSPDTTGVFGLGSPERTMVLQSIDNHVHLFDHRESKLISREHFQIEEGPQGGYLVKDRRSVCGTIVGNYQIGGDRKGGSCPLRDGNVIIVGGTDSPYVYQFLVVKEETESD